MLLLSPNLTVACVFAFLIDHWVEMKIIKDGDAQSQHLNQSHILHISHGRCCGGMRGLRVDYI